MLGPWLKREEGDKENGKGEEAKGEGEEEKREKEGKLSMIQVRHKLSNLRGGLDCLGCGEVGKRKTDRIFQFPASFSFLDNAAFTLSHNHRHLDPIR